MIIHDVCTNEDGCLIIRGKNCEATKTIYCETWSLLQNDKTKAIS